MRSKSMLLVCWLAMSGALQVQAQDGDGSVAQQLTLKDVKVTLQASDGSTVMSKSGTYPSTLLAKPQIPSKQSLEVVLTAEAGGQEFKPQQVMLLLKNKRWGVGAYAVGKSKAKGSTYTISASVVTLEKQLGKQAGEYDVILLVADPAAKNGIQWNLGTVEFVIPGSDPEAAPGIKTASLQTTSNIKPVIQHIFRQPDKRPPAMVSLVFTGLAFVPLAAVLLYVLFGLGVNFNAFPKDPSVALYALLFHGSLFLLLSVYMAFWLRWNLAETLPRALLLGVPIAYTGHKTLAGLASARLKKD